MDITTLFGIAIGVFSIFLGNVLEGGHFSALIQFTAFLIVFGGTLGATVVSNTAEDLRVSWALFKKSFSKDDEEIYKITSQKIIETAKMARKESVGDLEKRIDSFSDPFMKSVFKFTLDGVNPTQVEEVFYNRIDMEEQKLLGGAKVWADAGGFAPTIGIIGAVLGLIHVMGNLSDTTQLGKGIAVAFVATIYGVGSANLVFIPIGNKIKAKIKRHKKLQEMMIEGAVSVLNGSSSHVVAMKMQSYVDVSKRG